MQGAGGLDRMGIELQVRGALEYQSALKSSAAATTAFASTLSKSVGASSGPFKAAGDAANWFSFGLQGLGKNFNWSTIQASKFDRAMYEVGNAVGKASGVLAKVIPIVGSVAGALIGPMVTAATLATTAVVALTTAAAGLASMLTKNAVQAAMDFESAMVGVRRTMEPSRGEFEAMSRDIRDIARDIPYTTTQLGNIAEEAGRMGIRGRAATKEFVEGMADVLTTSTFTAEGAVRAYTRLSLIMEEPITNIKRVTSAATELDNTMATSEMEIIQFALRMASAGKVAGLTTADVLGVAAAFRELDIRSERGGSAVQMALFKIVEAIGEGGEQLTQFAQISGMTANEFAKAWEEDAAMTFVRFLGGIRESGDQANLVLDEMGLGAIRTVQALVTVAQAGTNLEFALNTSRRAWEAGNATQIEAQRVYATTASAIKVLQNRFHDAFIELGNNMLPSFRQSLSLIDNKILPAFRELTDAIGKEAIPTFIALANVLSGDWVRSTNLAVRGARNTAQSISQLSYDISVFILNLRAGISTLTTFASVAGSTLSVMGAARDHANLLDMASKGMAVSEDQLRESSANLRNEQEKLADVQTKLGNIGKDLESQIGALNVSMTQHKEIGKQDAAVLEELVKWTDASVEALGAEIEARKASIASLIEYDDGSSDTVRAYQYEQQVLIGLLDQLRSTTTNQRGFNDATDDARFNVDDFVDSLDDEEKGLKKVNKELSDAQKAYNSGTFLEFIRHALEAGDASDAWQIKMQEMVDNGDIDAVTNAYLALGFTADDVLEELVRHHGVTVDKIAEKNKAHEEAIKKQWEQIAANQRKAEEETQRMLNEQSERLFRTQVNAGLQAQLLAKGITNIGDAITADMDYMTAYRKMTELENKKIIDSWNLATKAIQQQQDMMNAAIERQGRNKLSGKARREADNKAAFDAAQAENKSDALDMARKLVEAGTKGIFDFGSGGYVTPSAATLQSMAEQLGKLARHGGLSLSDVSDLSGITELSPDIIKAIGTAFSTAMGLKDFMRFLASINDTSSNANEQGRDSMLYESGADTGGSSDFPSHVSSLSSFNGSGPGGGNTTNIEVNANYAATQEPVSIVQDLQAISMSAR